MKPAKGICYMFLFAILGVDRVQNLAKHNKRLLLSEQLSNKNIAIRSLCIVHEHKTKYFPRLWTSQHKSWPLCLLH